MQIILSEKDISEFLGIFMKSKALRDLIHEKLYQYDENIEQLFKIRSRRLITNDDLQDLFPGFLCNM